MAHNQFLTSPERCVEDMLNGVAATYPTLSVDIQSRIIFYSQGLTHKRSVGVLTGGGSGHEPFAAGFVGEGMLTAAVAGSVFSSPPPSHIFTAICNVATVSPGGVLVIFNNYTGDILNFGLALERAKNKSLHVKSIVVNEDCSIDAPEGAGKRGLCGCLFIIKIAGGLALMSKSLEEIYNECTTVGKSIATLGVTIKPCNMPGLGPMFHIEEGFMEVGVGVHGEAGASKIKLEPADKIARHIVDKLCRTLDIKEGYNVCIIVNNLGGTSQLELFLFAGQVSSQLKERGVDIVRMYTGTLMTSLDMSGIQVSMLLLPEDKSIWIDCLDTPTNAFGWPGNSLSARSCVKKGITTQRESNIKLEGPQINNKAALLFKKCLKAISDSIKENENKLNELDKGCGDGDTGSTLCRMANAILEELDNLPICFPQQCLMNLSQLAEEVMGGTSGALYSLLLVGASKSAPKWEDAWQSALDLATTYSKARIGNRTMFDALFPACEAFNQVMAVNGSWKEALIKAVEAADQGCKSTEHFKPLYGRASYVNISNMRGVDAGAFGVTVWLHAIKSQLL